jgi:hypothetical protein
LVFPDWVEGTAVVLLIASEGVISEEGLIEDKGGLSVFFVPIQYNTRSIWQREQGCDSIEDAQMIFSWWQRRAPKRYSVGPQNLCRSDLPA